MFEPLEQNDDEYEDEDDCLTDDEDSYEDDYSEDSGLPGFDDLEPFGSFDNGFGWEDGYL